MDVRLARPTDAGLVLSLALDAGAHVVKGQGWPIHNSTARTLARASLPRAMRGRTWIAQSEHTIALLEAEPRQYVIGWDIARLAARGAQADAAIAATVDAAVNHLQARGVPRLFARTGADASALLRPLGFAALAREFVLVGEAGSSSNALPAPPDSRYRMSQDGWPLHQLEAEITPPLVRQLEGLSSLEWSGPVRKMSEIVIERSGRVVGWIGWGTRLGPHYRSVGMLLHPDHVELAPLMVNHACKQTAAGQHLVARVRDYHMHLLRAFTDCGFEIVSEENLLVKHAGVEFAPVYKTRMSVSSVPGIAGLSSRVHPRRLVSATTWKDYTT